MENYGKAKTITTNLSCAASDAHVAKMYNFNKYFTFILYLLIETILKISMKKLLRPISIFLFWETNSVQCEKPSNSGFIG